ncbi:MAG: UbiA prenyltransferase family protein [Thermoguttaceae bacterium]|nr:UbiA prenyltransferase family protein [Thermoguttaceae bacterium]MDW8038769.1 UbiA prenyltransferase family protein [Thermoguttaceae bacterium]
MNPYIAIARPDHWFKNVFMLLGVLLAWFYWAYRPQTEASFSVVRILWGLAAVCLVASSNYVLNEILDAPSDRHHPNKRTRPIPSGQVRLALAYAEWLLLGAVGLGMAWTLHRLFFLSAGLLWLMGLVYNVPPIRAKEWPYLDVLVESVNNPLRLFLGWFTVIEREVPPLSLVVAYWMAGAFFMASKRFAEYRTIANPEQAGAYRASFRYYTEDKLLISMFFYATAAALFLGIFIIRYHLELVLSVPLIAGFFSYYLRIALRPNSPVQHPERLYREYGLLAYSLVCMAVFIGLMFVRIGVLYEWFNVPGPQTPPLWRW